MAAARGPPADRQDHRARRLLHRLQEAGVPVGGFMTAALRTGGRREGFLVDALSEQLIDRLVGTPRGEER